MTTQHTPLPCPFCGAELDHKTSTQPVDDTWEHPRNTDCPLSKMPTAMDDPFFIFDNQSDISNWNKRQGEKA